jgi:hypothetical protein
VPYLDLYIPLRLMQRGSRVFGLAAQARFSVWQQKTRRFFSAGSGFL